MNEATTPTKQDRARQFFEWARGFAALRMAYFGLRLGLLEALRSAPAGLTALDLASALGLDPRYVAAWAKAAYACELLSYDPATERFRLAPHMADLLLNESDPYYLAGIPLSLAVESRQVDRLLESFRTGGGIPFGDYGPDIVESLEALSRAAYEVYLPNVLLPSVPGLRERLSGGGKILELGCGAGVGLLSLARAFPGCTVTGLDPDEVSVARARERIEQAGLSDRVAAEVMRSEDLNIENVFDFVYVQTALHEMDDVVTALANARRALVEGGVLLITEVRGAERVEDATGAYHAALAHMDLFYEIPQSLAKGGLGVGFLNRQQVESLAVGAGFSEIRELELPVPLYAAFYAIK
ncbi:MAG TPA: class I SAM-dependent methyltransferase [Dehalococcoidia bacterium]|jgi:SAM-dependent methyltransferase|nr:class I SAM-dependent methyltransferase [Dehalococcoidia bacterium]